MKFFFLVLLFALVASIDAVLGKAPNPNKKCSKTQFKYYTPQTGTICLLYGGAKGPCKPPPYKMCPKNYQWHKYFKICVPKYPPKTSAPPQCPLKRKWDKVHQCCWKYNPTKPPTSSKTTTVTGPTQTPYAANAGFAPVTPKKLFSPFEVAWKRDEA